MTAAQTAEAKACAAKIRAAPVSASVRTFVASSAAAMKAAYGWLVRRPIKKTSFSLGQHVEKSWIQSYGCQVAGPAGLGS